MDDQLASMIINRLDDLKNDSNRNFDVLLNGQRTLAEHFEAHEKSNADDFSAIRLEAAVTKSTAEATATTKAKFWGGLAATISFLLGTLVRVLFHK